MFHFMGFHLTCWISRLKQKVLCFSSFSSSDSIDLNWSFDFFFISDKLYFIDFEYGSYSYRGYDIANHFNEYAGFDCDYSLYVSSRPSGFWINQNLASKVLIWIVRYLM